VAVWAWRFCGKVVRGMSVRGVALLRPYPSRSEMHPLSCACLTALIPGLSELSDASLYIFIVIRVRSKSLRFFCLCIFRHCCQVRHTMLHLAIGVGRGGCWPPPPPSKPNRRISRIRLSSR
jgi:hypothetical protein